MNAPDVAYKDGLYYFYFPYDKTYIANLMSAHYEMIEEPKYTGTKKKFDITSINVFPTIVESILIIKNNSPNSITYNIYNLQGKNVQQGKLFGNNPEIDVQSLDAGLYLVTFGDNNTTTSCRIIKK